MSLFIKGDELYSKHFPIVGMTPSFGVTPSLAPAVYRFNNNLSGVFGPYINRIQMYDGWTGKLLPSMTPDKLLTEMVDNLRANPKYSEAEKQRIRSNLYNNDTKKFTIGLIGTEKDIETTRKALDEYLNKP